MQQGATALTICSSNADLSFPPFDIDPAAREEVHINLVWRHTIHREVTIQFIQDRNSVLMHQAEEVAIACLNL